MRVHFRAAILEQPANILKRSARSLRVMRSHRPRGVQQIFSDSIRIGMQDKSRKDIAGDHSTEDESDPANYKNSARAERRKPFCRLCRGSTGANAHSIFGFVITTSGIAGF